MLRRLAIAALAVAATGSSGALAQDYPNAPIRLVVGYAPGGGADVSARIIGQKASEILGQPIIIENKPGAGTNLAAEIVAKSKPDGYTLLQGTLAAAIGKTLYENLNYDYIKDFSAVANFGSAGFVLLVPQNSPANSLKEFIDLAKKGDLSYGSSGTGSPSHLTAELLNSIAGIKMEHIPYGGGAPAVNAVLSGEVQGSFTALPTALPLMRSGKAKGLALTSAHRSELDPNLPTVAESGYPGFEAGTWYGAVAPVGTPEPILDKLHDAFAKALSDPSVKDRLIKLGYDIPPSTRQQFGDYIKSEVEKWSTIVKNSGAKPE